ncbi:MAG: hypothetical protein ACXAEU_25885, partial [Candidatus Hodarchaeales archaeon]
LATSEILFLFYQSITWFLFTKKKFLLSSLATAMTFALRFNGAFFVLGMFSVYFLNWFKEKRLSTVILIRICLGSIFMFLIGFSSFIWSYYFLDDFWLPLISEESAYIRWEGYTSGRVLSFPFIWWIDYLKWVILNESLLEFILFSMGLFLLMLGFISLYLLYSGRFSNINQDYRHSLFLLYAWGVLGVNIIVSGRNFSRFLISVFPVLPCLSIWPRNRSFSILLSLIIFISGLIVLIAVNLAWWSVVEPCLHCLPDLNFLNSLFDL